jgi:hypothetical protein
MTTTKQEGIDATWNHQVLRESQAEFLSLSLTEILTIHHRWSDSVHMQHFARNEDNLKTIEEHCCLYPKCCQMCCTCMTCTNCCSLLCLFPFFIFFIFNLEMDYGRKFKHYFK